MAGIASICVGRRGSGKTTVTKSLLDQTKLPIVVYDINQEYRNYYPEKFLDFDVFLDKIVDLRGHYIVIEEATIFFQKASHEKTMINLLVRARHTGNIIQLNFHSWFTVPKHIYTLLNYVIIFKTNDNVKNLDRFESPTLIQTFTEVQRSDDEYKNITIDLYAKNNY